MWTTQMVPANRPYDPAMPNKQKGETFFLDTNGFLAKRMTVGGQDVIVHYADIPESDITTIRGLRCTTALRTVIDLAVEIDAPELDLMVRDCLKRRLFTRDDARARIAEPDMATHPGARLLRQALLR